MRLKAKYTLLNIVLVLLLINNLNAQNFEFSHLPIIVINTNGGTIVDDPKIDADMGIIDNGESLNYLTDTFNNYDGQIAIETRGDWTQTFDKKSYGFELRNSLGEDIDASLLGLPEEEDWILYASFLDRTFIRNVLTHELWREMGYWSSRTRYCELVLNGEYRGIYILMEKVKRDNNRLDIAKLETTDNDGDDLTGGYLIRMDWPDGGGWYSQYGTMGGNPYYFQYEYPKEDDITSQQELYIQQYINDFEDAVFNNNFVNNDGIRYDSLIVLSSFVDLFIINELSRSVDAYKSSSYIHKDKDSNGGKLKAGPIWDFNMAYGNAAWCGTSTSSGWHYPMLEPSCQDIEFMPLWWERFMIDSVFTNKAACRWEELRQGPLHMDSIHNFIDNQVYELDSAIDRNFQKWDILGVQLFDEPLPVPIDYAGEIDRLKDWFTDRITWLDNNFYDCEISCLLGDVNGDGGFNIQDIVVMVNCVLAENCDELTYTCAADINGDGGFNVQDIVVLVNCVLADNCSD